jgi:hypothetical protein
VDEKRLGSPEEIVRELLTRFLRESPQPDDTAAAPLDNPRGLIASMDEWGVAHSGAARGMTRAVVGARPDQLDEISFVPLLVALVESVAAFGSLEDEKVDEFLRLRAPRIVQASNGTTRWAVLTAVTDREALVNEVLGPTPARPHHRSEPPAADVHLADAHHAEELRAALGMSLQEALNMQERSVSQQIESMFGRLVPRVSAFDPQVGAGLEWLVRNDPEALLAMPTTAAFQDALQGSTVVRDNMRLRFTHLLEVPDLGYAAFILWDTRVPLTARERAALAGNIRHLCDTAVAPWNHWRDLRSRREAFAVWVRRLRDDALEASSLADLLRSQHPGDYAREPRQKTVRRIYRISTRFNTVRLPQGLVRSFRAEHDAARRARAGGPALERALSQERVDPSCHSSPTALLVLAILPAVDQTAVDALFTTTSLVTLEGSAAVSTLIPNVLGFLLGAGFDRWRKVVGFIVAMALALFVATLATDKSLSTWVVAVINGFLIFASAVGLNSIGSSATSPQPPAPGPVPDSQGSAPKQLFQPWF